MAILTCIFIHLAVVNAETAEHTERLHRSNVLISEAVTVLLQHKIVSKLQCRSKTIHLCFHDAVNIGILTA